MMSFFPFTTRLERIFGRGTLLNWLWVAGGGAIGSTLRYGLALGVQRWLGAGWPYGTLAANLLGSFAIGWAFRLLMARALLGEGGRLFFVVGVLGGFTTFSAFSLETLRLLQSGAWPSAALYVACSVAGCLLAAWAGFRLGP